MLVSQIESLIKHYSHKDDGANLHNCIASAPSDFRFALHDLHFTGMEMLATVK